MTILTLPQQSKTTRVHQPSPELPPPATRQLLREEWGLTRHQVAEAFGVTVATVRSWETGRTSPGGHRRVRYARFLVGLAEATVDRGGPEARRGTPAADSASAPTSDPAERPSSSPAGSGPGEPTPAAQTGSGRGERSPAAQAGSGPGEPTPAAPGCGRSPGSAAPSTFAHTTTPGIAETPPKALAVPQTPDRTAHPVQDRPTRASRQTAARPARPLVRALPDWAVLARPLPVPHHSGRTPAACLPMSTARCLPTPTVRSLPTSAVRPLPVRAVDPVAPLRRRRLRNSVVAAGLWCSLLIHLLSSTP